MSTSFLKKCPECGSSNLIYDEQKGELICGKCGLVIEENMIDQGQEWRQFEEGERNL